MYGGLHRPGSGWTDTTPCPAAARYFRAKGWGWRCAHGGLSALRSEPVALGSRLSKVETELEVAVRSVWVILKLGCVSDKAISPSIRYAKIGARLEKTELHIAGEQKLEYGVSMLVHNLYV
jgi:hypothetical protein